MAAKVRLKMLSVATWRWGLAAFMLLAVGAPLEAQLVSPEIADRDKSGTTGGAKKTSDSQVAFIRQLASRVSFQAEGTGLSRAVFRITWSHLGLHQKSHQSNDLHACGCLSSFVVVC
jgi:hypothetical protein